MANCKACGAWFSSTAAQELCPTCERALKRLNGYAVPVVWCKNCDWYREDGSICVNPHCGKSFYGCRVRQDHYCSYGERREGE